MSSNLSIYSHSYKGNDRLIELNIYKEELYDVKHKLEKELKELKIKQGKLPDYAFRIIENEFKQRFEMLKWMINECLSEIKEIKQKNQIL